MFPQKNYLILFYILYNSITFVFKKKNFSHSNKIMCNAIAKLAFASKIL